MKKLLDKVLIFEEGQVPTLGDYVWLLLPYITTLFMLAALLIIVR
ncbi:hypothetical protein AAGS61_05770 [Lysinibacillus sp. KU-BSD001]